jgi:hypothetical protein
MVYRVQFGSLDLIKSSMTPDSEDMVRRLDEVLAQQHR